MSGGKFFRRQARRRWSEAEKQAIVAEVERPGVNISDCLISRRVGLGSSLLVTAIMGHGRKEAKLSAISPIDSGENWLTSSHAAGDRS